MSNVKTSQSNTPYALNIHRCGGTTMFPKRYCTDKKENQIFLIYIEIQNGAAAKS